MKEGDVGNYKTLHNANWQGGECEVAEGNKTETSSWWEAADDHQIKHDLVGSRWRHSMLGLVGYGIMPPLMDGIW